MWSKVVLCLFLVCFAVDAASTTKRTSSKREEPCKFTRDQVFQCMMYYVDGMGGGTKDKKITRDELLFAEQYYHQYMLNKGFDLKGRTLTQSVDVILRVCDKDHDVRINSNDFSRTSERCFSK